MALSQRLSCGFHRLVKLLRACLAHVAWLAILVTAAVAQQAEADFRSFTLGSDFQKPSEFEYGGEIVAGPGVRVDSYTRTYDENTVTMNNLGVYKGRIVLKQQIAFAPTKTVCAEGIIKSVEGLVSAGVTGWQHTWREDYQMPVYTTNVNTEVGQVMAKVTCRMKESVWFLEYTQALRGFNQ